MTQLRRSMMFVNVFVIGLVPSGARSNEPPKEEVPKLHPTTFQQLPLGAVKPTGWLQAQLKTQAAGLGGHLDEFWPDIKNSAWSGGKAEGWERVPYWLDGFVPLAYLLDDPSLQERAKRYIEHIIDHQTPDGWLGPIGDTAGHKPYDPWPLFPLFKALTQYQEATGDPKIVPALLRCAHKIDQVIDQTPLYSWARMRAADFAISLYWLHARTGEAWLLDLARKVFAQSHDWRAQFDDFKFTGKTQGKFELDTHGVNTGMALKYGGVRYRLTGDPNDRAAIFRMLDFLDRYHGQATGIFTCDEHLAGRSPSQGTELCTVVEAMYSLELLSSILGDARLGDRLEMLAFNALPATFKKDMTAHQYDQQCNQVICSKQGEHVYVNNEADSNLFGLEPNFGCCTANFHQGWPKFASSLWMQSLDGGLAAISYAPCVVETKIQGKPVKVEVVTSYPFRDTILIKVNAPEEVSFPLCLRTPTWAEGAEVKSLDFDYSLNNQASIGAGSQGTKGKTPPGFVEFWAKWKGTSTVSLRFPMPVRLYQGFHDAVAIQRGPLVYALKVGAEWRKVKDNPKFADWEVYPTTPWNYALAIDRSHPNQSVTFHERPVGSFPFSVEGAPLIAMVKGRRLHGWALDRGAAAPPPASPITSATGPLEDLTLIPYGCTDLRITEFPTLTGP
jgi:DUF1680 family protein